MRKILAILAIVALFFSACQKKEDKVVQKNTAVESSMKIDKENKSITIMAKVNGKYFTENTRHAIVFEGGKYGDKPVFIALANQNDFYKAMIELGGVAGNNMSKENAMTTKVEGQKVTVSVTWEGAPKVYDINEVISDSNNLPIDIRFGGNEANAKEFNTGCITCLDSCPVGILSNHTYTMGAVEKRSEVVFHGKADVLPKDGTLVKITFKI